MTSESIWLKNRIPGGSDVVWDFCMLEFIYKKALTTYEKKLGLCAPDRTRTCTARTTRS